MKVSIIVDDKTVVVDGKARYVEAPPVNEMVHAVQWSGASGWVEYKEDEEGNRPLNQRITNLQEFQPWVDAWTAAGEPTP